MNRTPWKFLAGALIAFMLVGGVGAYAVYAQGGAPPTQSSQPGGPGPRGPHILRGAELDAAAQALGMTSDDLTAELKSGKTLSDIATEKGVQLQTVQDAIKAAHEAELRTQINQAVTDGKMSQEKANWLLEGLDQGFLSGPGPFGLGGLRGGGPQNGGQGGAAPTQTP